MSQILDMGGQFGGRQERPLQIGSRFVSRSRRGPVSLASAVAANKDTRACLSLTGAVLSPRPDQQ